MHHSKNSCMERIGHYFCFQQTIRTNVSSLLHPLCLSWEEQIQKPNLSFGIIIIWPADVWRVYRLDSIELKTCVYKWSFYHCAISFQRDILWGRCFCDRLGYANSLGDYSTCIHNPHSGHLQRGIIHTHSHPFSWILWRRERERGDATWYYSLQFLAERSDREATEDMGFFTMDYD